MKEENITPDSEQAVDMAGETDDYTQTQEEDDFTQADVDTEPSQPEEPADSNIQAEVLASLPKSNIDGKGFEDVDGLRTSKQGKIYVQNDVLLREVLKSKEQDELTPMALKMFDLMIQNISSKKYYNNPDDKKDCWQSAYLDILMYWRGFDPEKTSNAFAYFTSLIINGLNKGWHKCAGKLKTSDIVSLDNNIHTL